MTLRNPVLATVLLLGLASCETTKVAAQKVADGVTGAAHAVGTATTDSVLTIKVKDRLIADQVTTVAKFSVKTVGSVVTLSGSVPSAEVKARALELATTTAGVTQVISDDLVVAP